MVQKRLGKESWARWAGPEPCILGLTGSAGNRQQGSFLVTLPKTDLGWALTGEEPEANQAAHGSSGLKRQAQPAPAGININRIGGSQTQGPSLWAESAHWMSEAEGTLKGPLVPMSGGITGLCFNTSSDRTHYSPKHSLPSLCSSDWDGVYHHEPKRQQQKPVCAETLGGRG